MANFAARTCFLQKNPYPESQSCKYCQKLVFLGLFRNGAECVSCGGCAHGACVPGGIEKSREACWRCDLCCSRRKVESITSKIVCGINPLEIFDDKKRGSSWESYDQRMVSKRLTTFKSRVDMIFNHHDGVFDKIQGEVGDVWVELEEIGEELEAVKRRAEDVSEKLGDTTKELEVVRRKSKYTREELVDSKELEVVRPGAEDVLGKFEDASKELEAVRQKFKPMGEEF